MKVKPASTTGQVTPTFISQVVLKRNKKEWDNGKFSNLVLARPKQKMRLSSPAQMDRKSLLYWLHYPIATYHNIISNITLTEENI